jgi:hypothetical protein
MANNPGPFFFAWVDANDTPFDPVAHRRVDEVISAFSIEQQEGDFASMDATVKNPRIGLLNTGRKVWAWFSWDANWVRRGTITPDMRPLFFGRLVGIPDGINREAVTLSFLARPLDFAEQKASLAEGMRDLPEYDPVFITPDAQLDPDTVLEARPELWHTDRVTLEVTSSNIIVGEDGVEEFFESEVPYDSVDIRIGSVPARAIAMTGQVSWTQASSGGVGLGRFQFFTYAGSSLYENWPKTGDSLDGGWYVQSASISDNFNIDKTEVANFSIQWANTAEKHAVGDTLSTSLSSSQALLPGGAIRATLTSGGKTSDTEASSNSTSIAIPLWALTAHLTLGYNAKRPRKESISFTLKANFQNLVTLPEDTDVVHLNVNGGDVGLPTQVGSYGGESEVPIGDTTRRTYFATGRGLSSLEYLICRARAQLLLASRAIEITFTCKFDRAIELSCRKNAILHDRRLPGGIATGKIVGYSIKLDGSDGAMFGEVTIACSIGYGGVVEPVDGDPVYVEDDYVEYDYQQHEGGIVVLDAGDVGYSVPLDAPNDDGITFPLRGRAGVKSVTVHGSLSAQQAGIDGIITPPQNLVYNAADLEKLQNRSTEVPQQVQDFLKDAAIWVEIKLKNLNGNFNDIYPIEVTTLEMPKGIDLEADSNS